jgi:protein SCO1/2
MADMIDKVKDECGDILVPVMISCDPARDKPSVLKPYLKEFHDDIIGLTGEYDEIKKTCKEYRVYFSTPPTLKAGQDYLVDHSIYFYLMGTCFCNTSVARQVLIVLQIRKATS